jgi:NAD(P)-dependent dehydrogenase (short-subunit alcohol dehydrogenase family)
MRPQPSRIILVTGASRGIGAEVARQLADPDTHVVVNYREKATAANAIVAAIRAAGGRASTLAADISDDVEATAMIDAIADRFGRLDTLILSASGGLESGAAPGYAMRLNRDAQRRLVQLAMPLMPAGGRIVYVTSHQAHFFPHKAVPKGYSGVAASMRAGETALYAMRSEFDRAGIRFTVVSGDIVDGTFVPAAIVDVANRPNPSGIVYVGGADYLMTA